MDVRPEDRLRRTGHVGPGSISSVGTVTTSLVTTSLVATSLVPTSAVPLDLEDRDPRPPRSPDSTGVAVRDGVRVPYAVYGAEHPRTVVLLPTWTIIPSRVWKLQVPTLARHARVVTFEGRGSAAGDRPTSTAAYRRSEFAEDTVAVLDAAGVDHALLVGFSMGAPWAVRAAAEHPDRVDALLLVTSSGTGVTSPGRHLPFDARPPQADAPPTVADAPPTEAQGWDLYNRHVWLDGGWETFLQFFFRQVFPEPHSTKAVEDAVRWGRRADPAAMVRVVEGGQLDTPAELEADCRRLRCPVVVLEGTEDGVRPWTAGERLAEWTGGSLVVVQSGGHAPHLRDPVRVNHLIQEMLRATDAAMPPAVQEADAAMPPAAQEIDAATRPAVTRPARRRTWVRAQRRPRRVLYLSSPIGLGHARRDVAVARELRTHHPDLVIDWLAQHPVTRVLEDAGERVHPASAWLANESAHIEDESEDHDLHAFQAIRRMDEILVNNFMVFDEVVEEGCYDLVVGDEAWEVDHFLHENPELKRFSFAWMTDFVGWLPMPEDDAREIALTADYNAEMIEQRARYRRIRDRSIFVGNPDDVVDRPFGPGLPGIREWTEANFDFSGYVTGYVPPTSTERVRLRAGLGYGADDRLCVVTVGGSGVGESLLRRVLDAVPVARRLVPGLRFLVVTGPRIDPDSLPRRRGVSYRGYLPDLHHHLAACDVAVVQGGLTTCMELAAAGRPFLYVPLRHHFEQNVHVRHRLERYGAGRCLDYERACDPEALAGAIAEELGRDRDGTRPVPVETDGAGRAAAMLAELL